MTIDYIKETNCYHAFSAKDHGFSFFKNLFIYKGKSEVVKVVLIWGDIYKVRNYRLRHRSIEELAKQLLTRSLNLSKWNDIEHTGLKNLRARIESNRSK